MHDTGLHLSKRNPSRASSLWRWVILGIAGGLGGVFPDFGHFLWWVTKGQVDWMAFHTPSWFYLLFVCTLALLAGLGTTLLLRGKGESKKT